ncbi:uncharacterized protein LOC62_01G000368 [Vanrija pseudolonga]|uniref:Uncharacterized protein n=1 Tax=Vanrija pseudolonga TaxID=143232 RepID=A0AAF0Y337_9TREE|nr:hypothetical protein LOC62_01G000368 [Vanrija pseudolonga]
MFNQAIIVSLFVALGALAQGNLTVDSPPSVTQCQPTRFTWHGGAPPYFVRIIPDGTISSTLETLLQDTTETSLTWIADQPADTVINLAVKDSTGLENYSSKLTVQKGSTTDCKNNSTAPATGGTGGASGNGQSGQPGQPGGQPSGTAGGTGGAGGAGGAGGGASSTGSGAAGASGSGTAAAGASSGGASGGSSGSATSAPAGGSSGAAASPSASHPSSAMAGVAAPGLAVAALAVAAALAL